MYKNWCNLLHCRCTDYKSFTIKFIQTPNIKIRHLIQMRDQHHKYFYPKHTTKSTSFQTVSVSPSRSLRKTNCEQYKTTIFSGWKNRNASFICIITEKNITRLHISSDKNTSFQFSHVNRLQSILQDSDFIL